MDVFEAMRKRRMHRRFSDEPVSEDVLGQLVRAAALAPMGGNELVRRLIVVTDPRVVKTVRDVTPSFLANSPALIVVCTDLERAEASMGRQGRDILSLLDAGAAAENVALAAPALGVGISFVRSVNDSALREVLGLPEHVRPDILIGVGHPAATPSPAPPRRPAVVFRDRFGDPWEAST
jgi:nitroreductase